MSELIMNDKTAEHYSKQWGSKLGFGDFILNNPEAAKLMPARQLPWASLFDDIRGDSLNRTVEVFDAACGFGDVLRQLIIDPLPTGLRYLGADIHNALSEIPRPSSANLIQWDITKPLTSQQNFDYIICRAAIHHTPNPRETFRVLANQLKSRGVIAISAYAKKSPMREAIDDTLREKIVSLPNEEAFIVANQLTALGRDLQASNCQIIIHKDLPLLEINAGVYDLQAFIYKYFIKCWFNTAFSEDHCDLVNFDWYHPPYAFRYSIEDLREWALENSLTIVKEASTDAQHFMQCKAR
jgi:SAM-dependent methyltransferase